MTDRELLELAAKAAGLNISPIRQEMRDADGFGHVGLWIHGVSTCWNPLTDDAAAMRLAVTLGLDLLRTEKDVEAIAALPQYAKIDTQAVVAPFGIEALGNDPYAATRRAIVRAAAEIARAKTQ